MFDILHYAFMQRALLASALIGIVCAVIGVYVVLKGFSFISAGLAHASFGGVAVGFLLGINPILSAVVFVLLTAWGIGWSSKRGQIKEDTAVGIFFAATMAFGVLIIGLLHSYNIDLFGYLFGSVLAVSRQDLWMSGGMSIIVLTTVFLFYKELLFITFDPEMAAVAGVPATALYYLLLSLIALTIVLSLRVVGIILVSALVIIPAATAYQFSNTFSKMMGYAIVVGLISTTGGLFLSYYFDIASGATIVLTATALFFVAALFSPKGRRRKELISNKIVPYR